MIFSIDVVKASDKIQRPFLNTALGILGIEDGYLNWISGVYNKLIANIIVNQERFPSKVGNKARMPCLITSI